MFITIVQYSLLAVFALVGQSYGSYMDMGQPSAPPPPYQGLYPDVQLSYNPASMQTDKSAAEGWNIGPDRRRVCYVLAAAIISAALGYVLSKRLTQQDAKQAANGSISALAPSDDAVLQLQKLKQVLAGNSALSRQEVAFVVNQITSSKTSSKVNPRLLIAGLTVLCAVLGGTGAHILLEK